MEDWKVVENTNGEYWVSNLGNVWTCRGKIFGMNMKPTINNLGYYKVHIIRDNKPRLESVHRLVAKAFVQGYQEGLIVNHIDHVRHNNHYTNLEWITHAENIRLGYQNKNNSDF